MLRQIFFHRASIRPRFSTALIHNLKQQFCNQNTEIPFRKEQVVNSLNLTLKSGPEDWLRFVVASRREVEEALNSWDPKIPITPKALSRFIQQKRAELMRRATEKDTGTWY